MFLKGNIVFQILFSDVSRVLSRTRQRPVDLFRIRHVLRGHSNQSLFTDECWYVDDVLHVRRGVRSRCDFPLRVSTGNQKQDDERRDVIQKD